MFNTQAIRYYLPSLKRFIFEQVSFPCLGINQLTLNDKQIQ